MTSFSHTSALFPEDILLAKPWTHEGTCVYDSADPIVQSKIYATSLVYAEVAPVLKL